MPIPKVEKYERTEHYVKRFMKNKVMVKEYPKPKQRVAVAFSQLRKGGRKNV